MIEIDGIVARRLLCPPDLNPDYVETLIQEADIDAVVTEEPQRWSHARVNFAAKARVPEPVGVRTVTERATDG